MVKARHNFERGVYIFPFNSKSTDKPLTLKKLAIGILEVVPHVAGVEGLFSMMTAIKTKSWNRMLPTTLKMISQIKLHLLQGDNLLACQKARKHKATA
ncbi:hypothetical protein VP01_431g2 [Puccinia sorghi]|uniref:HAT C-terminal dimerisation domain-containing protein n=1 Tax=Puccinia sorghi TaxID=27349 RepID=A0A0L6UQ03_9BASI|nr:hypothetical protein VP01_431g2 [Puccinia sorghi]